MSTCNRARTKAAARAGMPFFLLPVIFNPAIYIPLLLRLAHHVGTWNVAAIYFGWLVLMLASLALGFYRRQKYFRDHPVGEG